MNSSYIPKLTQHTSLLVRSRLYSYRKSIGPRNRVRQPGNTAKTQFSASKRHKRDRDNQYQINKLFTASHIFHWTPYVHDQETNMKVQWECGKLKHFNLTTQKWYRLPRNNSRTQGRSACGRLWIEMPQQPDQMKMNIIGSEEVLAQEESKPVLTHRRRKTINRTTGSESWPAHLIRIWRRNQRAEREKPSGDSWISNETRELWAAIGLSGNVLPQDSTQERAREKPDREENTD
jgi:hypothetical protein